MRIFLSIILLMTLTLTTSAEEITTNNLITNGNFETGNSNSWTTSGDVQVLSDCCELNNISSNYDLEFGDSGSIEQEFDLTSDTITQNMLDNGITLNSSVEVQNGECGVSGCWGGNGPADSFTITLQIKDSDGNVLATNTTIRTDVTGIEGANFTDRLIYNGQNSNLGNLEISGTDANAPGTLGGPNLDNIIVTMTYDDEVISNEIIEEIENVFEELKEETFKELKFEEEFAFEIKEEPKLEETFMMEEFTEVVSMTEEKPEMLEEKPEVMEESMVEEKPEEEMITEELIAEAKEEMPQEIQEEKEEEIIEEKEEESTEEAPKKEIKTKVTKKAKKPKIDKIMAKVDAQIKDSAKNLQIKNLIKLDAMQNDAVSLLAYNNIEFYKPKDIYIKQVPIFDNRSIYKNIDLVKYIDNDVIDVKIKKLNEIKLKKRKLILELQELQNG